MKTTVASLVVVVPCESRNVTSLEGTDLLPGSSGSLCFVLFVQNLCGKCFLELSLTHLFLDVSVNVSLRNCQWKLNLSLETPC